MKDVYSGYRVERAREIMQVDETEKGFVIVRGRERDTFFCFFVDSDSSCWSKLGGSARFYAERSKAETDLIELRRRARERRKNRQA
jgi:hypothetical protein